MSDTWFKRGPVLVIGSAGQLGGEFVRELDACGITYLAAEREPGPDRLGIDLLRPDALREAVIAARPAVVLNAAAYTAVDRAESDAGTCMDVNARAPEALAAACRDLDALLVHFSTDYVFDGRGNRPYTEDDPAAPLNRYGLSKLRGEQAVCASGSAHLVFRTSGVYSPGGHNFVATMLRLFRREQPVRVVDDQVGCPTSARVLARAVTTMLAGSAASDVADARGLYHLCSAGQTSWYGFARAIHELADPPATATLVAIDSATFGAPAARPAYCAMDCGKARRVFGIALPPWREQLRESMPEFNARAANEG